MLKEIRRKMSFEVPSTQIKIFPIYAIFLWGNLIQNIIDYRDATLSTKQFSEEKKKKY